MNECDKRSWWGRTFGRRLINAVFGKFFDNQRTTTATTASLLAIILVAATFCYKNTSAAIESRVKVYKVRCYDITTDEFLVSRRMADESGAAKMGGEIMLETGILIDRNQLERGEDWTERDFVPKSAP